MTRSAFIFLIALAALFGSLTAAFATQNARDFDLRGYVDAAQDANLPYRLPRSGVNVDLRQYTPAEMETQLDQLKAAHFTWLSQPFDWDSIEPQQGQFNWEQSDAIIAALHGQPDLHLIAVLNRSPAWARTNLAPDSPTAPPADPNTFAAFAKAFAARYQDTVDFYEVWDEPNIREAWGFIDPRSADYAALLQSAYIAIHQADPQATVIAAALAPTLEAGPRNLSDTLYLSQLYALGLREMSDAIAAKPFGFDVPQSDRAVREDTLNFSRITAMREIMVAHGDGNKALWALSGGWNSLPADWNGQPSIWGQVSTKQQVDYTLAAQQRAEREWPWLAGLILYHWQPNTPADDPLWGFALHTPTGQPTPLLEVLIAIPDQPAASNGLYPAANPYARYSGVWSFSPLGADIGWVVGSQAEFDFTGQAISLLVRKGHYVAYLYPSLNDQANLNRTPRDASGNPYVVLTSPSLEPELTLVPLADNLATQTHTLRLIPDRGWDQWALVDYAVSDGDLAAPYNNQINVAWFTTLVSALAVLISAWQLAWESLWRKLTSVFSRFSPAWQLLLSITASLLLMVGMLFTWVDHAPAIFRKEAPQLLVAILTAGLMYLQPAFILTIAAACLLFFILYHRPDFGLALTVFWSPFFLFPLQLFRFAFPMAEVITLLTFSAWLLRTAVTWAQQRKQPDQPKPTRPHFTLLDYGLIAWLIVALLSLIWTTYRTAAITDLRVMFVEPLLFYAVLRFTVAAQPKTLRLCLNALILAGVTVSLIGLWQYWQGDAIITAEAGARRLASVYGSPNNVGLFLGRVIPLILALVLAPLNRRYRLAACAALGITSLAVLLTQSVGAIFIGIPIAVLTVLLLSLHGRARFAVLAFSALLVVGFIVSLQFPRFARALDFSSGTNFFRLRVWESASNIIADHPLNGLGQDQFLYAFRGQYILPDAEDEPSLSHPHNILLDFWLRLGILGLPILFALQAGFWNPLRATYRALRGQTPSLQLALTIGVIGSMANLISHGLIDNSIYVHDLIYVFMLLSAFAAHLADTAQPHHNF